MSARAAQSTTPGGFLRMQVYVDDPLLAARGSENSRFIISVKVILVWLAMGHRLAWHKARLGLDVRWISIKLCSTPGRIVATIKPELMEDVRRGCVEVLQNNVYSLKKLRTLVGKAVHISGLLYMWRPFVRMLWAPLVCSTEVNGNAPSGCCWSSQIRLPSLWILAFLGQQLGTMERVFVVATYMNAGVPVKITTDASPWGLGGVLEKGGVLTE